MAGLQHPQSWRSWIAAMVITLPFLTVGVGAQTQPDRENGRYSFSQSSDGSFVRLDTRSGSIATCKRSAAGWACYAAPDERDAFDKEIGRLQADNARLKEQLAKRDLAEPGSKTDAQLPKADSLKSGESAQASKPSDSGAKIELQLPDDKDIDRVVSFLERAWRRLVEAANRMQRDVTGRI